MAEVVAPARRQRRLRRRLVGAAVAALAVVALVVGCSEMERSLVYPASHYDRAEFQRRVEQGFAGRATILLPFDALIVEPESAPALATAIYFHGNGDVNTQLAALAPVFVERRLRLVLAEYPGYGARPGEPSERALIADAGALYAAIERRYPGVPIIVIGQSLGSGVAAQVAAAALPPPARLVLITPFMNLREAASHAAGGLPLGSLFSDRYDSAAAIARYDGPLAILVAAHDRMIGPEQGRRLAKLSRAHGESTLLELADANHDSWSAQMTPARWDALLAPSAAGR